MSSHPITLTVPTDIYERARQLAEQTDQTVETVLLGYLEASASQPLPAEEQAELDALAYLSDDALWTIAREQMPAEYQAKMQTLMALNSQGKISRAQQDELTELAARGQQLTLRKAEAMALLTRRGHTVTRDNLTPNNG